MRTTLTLEADVSARLRLEMRRTGKPLKQVLNEYLRLGFEKRAPGRAVKRFQIGPLAIEHGVTLCTSDRDFTRFPGLRILNPLHTQV